MKLDFSCVPQTSRTLIIERFNDQVTNLCTLLKGKTPSEMLSDVEEKLCVKSFEEFRKIFKPVVYEISYMDENGRLQSVNYSLENKEGANCYCNEIYLCDHEFYKAVHKLAQQKAASAVNNEDIPYDALYEALDPKTIYTRARRRREEVKQYVTSALEENDKGNPDGARRWMKIAGQVYQEVGLEYSGSALRLLPLAVRDIEVIIEQKLGISTDEAQKLGMSEGQTTLPTLIPCTVQWDAEGNLIATKIEPAEQAPAKAIEMMGDKVKALTAQGWEQTADAIPEGTIDKDLFLSIYSEQHSTALANLPTETLLQRHQELGDNYIAAQQSFCNAVGYLVQKVASLEQFFLHAGDESGIVESGVIIANCSASDIIENMSQVSEYLKNARNNEKDHVWVAVLPAMMNSDATKRWEDNAPGGDFDPFSFFDDMATIKKPERMDGIVSVSDINQITERFAEFGILSFVNFNACEETGFKDFGANTTIINEYEAELKGMKRRDSIVLSYPNFTIIPKNKSQLKELVNGKNLYVPSIYIDAAYVAAGIVVATQNENIQKKIFGKRVKEGRPFMRFDLEEKQNCCAFMAKFNPESRVVMDTEVVHRLQGKSGNAFCFRSDPQQNNAFVLTARTLNAKPIYYFLTQNYFSFLLERMFSIGKVTITDIKAFINAVTNIVENESGSDIVNILLQTGDEFLFNEQTKRPALRFKGIEEPADIKIDIQD